MNTISVKYIGLYARVSSKGQLHTHFDDRCSLDTQWDIGVSFCERTGLDKDLLRLYREEGRSATSTNRPEYKRLIDDIKNDKLYIILFLRNDRISRNYIDFTELYEMCTKHNVALIPIDIGKPIDLDDPQEWFTNSQKLIYSQHESKMTSRRVRDYQNNQLSKGFYPYGGTLTIGLTKTSTGKISLSSNLEEVETVKEIFDSLIKGESAISISDRFTFEYRLKKIWNPEMIIRIAKNTLYKGIYIHKKTGKVYDNLYEGNILISNEEFDTCQYQLIRYTKNKKYDYLFSNIIYCSVCGNPLVQKSTNKKGKIYQYYYCEECKKRVNENKIHEQMHDKLVKIYREEIMKEKYTEKEKNLDDEINVLEKRINEFYQMVINDPDSDLRNFHDFQKKTNKRINILKEEKKKLLKNCINKNVDLSKHVKEKVIKKYIDKIYVNLSTNLIVKVESHSNINITNITF